jgi:two-component system, cell cycle response regulator
MSSTPATRSSDLVPLAERLPFLRTFRLTAALACAAAWLLLPDQRTTSSDVFLVAMLTYGAVTLGLDLVWNALRLRWRYLLGVMVLVDGLWLAVMNYTFSGANTAGHHSGVGGALFTLILLQLIVICLLASFRTGVKVAMWSSLLMVLTFHAREAGVFGTPVALGDVEFHQLILSIALLWIVTLTTASFVAVNERELRRRRYDLEALAGLAFALESTSDSSAVGDVLATAVVDQLGYRRAAVVQVDEMRRPRLLAHRGGVDTPPAAVAPVSSSALIAARDQTLLRTRLNPDHDPWLSAVLPEAKGIVIVPMQAEGRLSGFLIGELGEVRDTGAERRLIGVTERFASQSALALANASLLARVRRLATRDDLTGLSNRRAFNEMLGHELARAQRQNHRLSLVLFDLDHFKLVNDTLGHPVGDALLRRVADQAKGLVRLGDVVARYGGEEFAMILPNADLDAALAMAERLRETIASGIAPTTVTTSLGVAVYPDHGRTAEALLSAADAALYASKNAGRNRTSAAPPMIRAA